MLGTVMFVSGGSGAIVDWVQLTDFLSLFPTKTPYPFSAEEARSCKVFELSNACEVCIFER